MGPTPSSFPSVSKYKVFCGAAPATPGLYKTSLSFLLGQ